MRRTSTSRVRRPHQRITTSDRSGCRSRTERVELQSARDNQLRNTPITGANDPIVRISPPKPTSERSAGAGAHRRASKKRSSCKHGARVTAPTVAPSGSEHANPLAVIPQPQARSTGHCFPPGVRSLPLQLRNATLHRMPLAAKGISTPRKLASDLRNPRHGGRRRHGDRRRQRLPVAVPCTLAAGVQNTDTEDPLQQHQRLHVTCAPSLSGCRFARSGFAHRARYRPAIKSARHRPQRRSRKHVDTHRHRVASRRRSSAEPNRCRLAQSVEEVGVLFSQIGAGKLRSNLDPHPRAIRHLDKSMVDDRPLVALDDVVPPRRIADRILEGD